MELQTSFLQDELRLTACQEAGHAAMFWFFQQQNFLSGINMVGADHSRGFSRQSSISLHF